MPIQQHPIPQEVAGYKFRLIGDMTVKQFIWLAAGILLGIVFYSLPLPFFFKYPLAAISVALGAGSAFVPIQGRPMDKWLIAFIKSIYSPTQYVWSKRSADPAYSRGTTAVTPTIKAAQPATAVGVTAPRSEAKIPSMLEGQPPPIAPAAPVPTREVTPAVSKPIGEVRVPVEETIKIAASTPSVPPQIPVVAAPKVGGTSPVVEEAPRSLRGEGVQERGPEAPTQRLPIPFTPTTPNTLVGMTLTPEGKILPAALVEIKLRGNTIRATKSNQLGQFLFAKPLDNSLYQIATEKEGYTFDTYSIDLTGQIVKPLKLQAKASSI
ncbi:PrgI family protein [Candidatus Curtissbacteria bacterium]|nr:PrgI family protein [Candidatus Curtissbacteria bacterium]